MCGIAGILDFKNVLLKDQLVSNTKLMTQQMRHRGPDDDAMGFEHNHVCFGHRRLSIIDLSQNSSQPLLDSTKRYYHLNEKFIITWILKLNSKS